MSKTLKIVKATHLVIGDTIVINHQPHDIIDIEDNRLGRELHLMSPTGQLTVQFMAEYETVAIEL